MVEGRTQRPVIDESKCGTCGICLRQCPADFFVEYRREPDSIRGTVYRTTHLPPLVERQENAIPPCQHACPLGQDVRGYVSLIAQGRFKEALALIKETNPFPAVCGLICHHPCELACVRGSLDDPVSIRALKGFLGIYESDGAPPAGPKTNKRTQTVAIVGAGPAGLAAAHDLAGRGYGVTVFESLQVAGGMLRVGIPEFRLPRDILQAEIDAILGLGVELKTGETLGKDFTLDELRGEGFAATLVATGAHHSQRLGIEREDLEGICGGVEFLRRVNLGEPFAIGKRVAVIGGGNVAIDSARLALRLGAKEVDIYYRRRRQEMPAMAEEVREARYEGIRIHWLTTPTSFLGDNGQVRGMSCLKNRLGAKDASGRRRPVAIEGSEHTIEAESVIVSIGQQTGVRDLGIGTERSGDGTILVDPQTAATSIPGVFAGGDVVTGPGWAIDAIAWGKKAALGIHRYLSSCSG